ncbi:unnamed protein product, partial [Brenthis ino]
MAGKGSDALRAAYVNFLSENSNTYILSDLELDPRTPDLQPLAPALVSQLTNKTFMYGRCLPANSLDFRAYCPKQSVEKM